MSITTVYTEPGAYSQFKPSATLPALSGGVRVVALVGAGRETHVVNSEVVTRGITADTADAPLHTAVSLGSTIIDEDFNSYILGTDYQLTTGEVDWSISDAAGLTGTIAQPFNGLVGTTMKITANGGTEQTYTFLAGDFAIITAATAAEVVAALTAAFTDVSVTVDTNKVKIETTAVNNATLLIGTGTANSILGFTDGSYVVGPKEPAAGKTYTISYEYAKVPADYTPEFYFNMNDIVTEFGDVSTTNTLSLGAEIVFQHGASAVCLIQTDPADGAVVQQFREAIDKLAPVTGINIVVPLSTDTTLQSYLKNHVDTASSLLERRERTGIMGMSGSPSISTVMGYATALNSKRMVLVHPTSGTRYVGAGATPETLNGAFLAAAVAGIRASRAYDVAEPLTRKEIIGFEAIPDVLLRAEKNQLGNAGISVIENVSGIYRVRHGVTTAPSSVDTREYSVVETIDYVSANMRTLLEAIFIGQKILADTPSQIRSTIQAVLSDLVSKEILVAFQNIQAAVNITDPTQIDVSFSISPVYPLNYILISFSLTV